MFLNFSSLCTKSAWVGWLRRVAHVEGRKKRKAIRPKEQKKRRFWLKQSQSKWLAFIVTRCEECKREKRRKR